MQWTEARDTLDTARARVKEGLDLSVPSADVAKPALWGGASSVRSRGSLSDPPPPTASGLRLGGGPAVWLPEAPVVWVQRPRSGQPRDRAASHDETTGVEVSEQEGTGVTVNALHPGVARTELGRHTGMHSSAFSSFTLGPIFWLLVKSPRLAAQTSTYLAVAEELEGVSGKYFDGLREKAPAPEAEDDEVARRLWAESARLVGLKVS